MYLTYVSYGTYTCDAVPFLCKRVLKCLHKKPQTKNNFYMCTVCTVLILLIQLRESFYVISQSIISMYYVYVKHKRM